MEIDNAIEDLKQQAHVQLLSNFGIFHRAAGVMNKDNKSAADKHREMMMIKQQKKDAKLLSDEPATATEELQEKELLLKAEQERLEKE